MIDDLFASPYLTVRRASEVSQATRAAAQNTIDKLVGIGLLREITGKQRNRVYCADEVLRQLDAPLSELSQLSGSGNP